MLKFSPDKSIILDIFIVVNKLNLLDTSINEPFYYSLEAKSIIAVVTKAIDNLKIMLIGNILDRNEKLLMGWNLNCFRNRKRITFLK